MHALIIDTGSVHLSIRYLLTNNSTEKLVSLLLCSKSIASKCYMEIVSAFRIKWKKTLQMTGVMPLLSLFPLDPAFKPLLMLLTSLFYM